MSDNMIERVAKATYNNWRKIMIERGQDKYVDMPLFENIVEKDRLFALEQAKAVIQAMREPTEEMCLEASKLGICRGFHLGIDGPKNCWQSMIDVALKEDINV